MNAYLLSLVKDANIADQWDFGFLHDFLVDNNFEITETKYLPRRERAIVVIPARHHAGMEDLVNDQLDGIDHVVLFLMGDEEADFDADKIKHRSIHIWVQNPHPGKHNKYHRLGTGYPTHMRELMPTEPPSKTTDVFFSGQITHPRREQMKVALDAYSTTHARIFRNYTESFTSGLSKEKYFDEMSKAKIAPCPSGAVIPDSFRLFEALECMAIPIADDVNSDNTVMEYWDWLFAEVNPIPKVTSWERMHGLVPELLRDWPRNMHEITAWWIKYKRDFAYKVREQLDVKKS